MGTPSNFGSLGERPTHPRLLDDLALRFVDSGWSIKWLLREIVLSSTYRQQSLGDAGKEAADPANRLLWRMPRRRLDVETWRDALLSVAGRLDRRVGGRSVNPQDPKVLRRTLYSRISRLDLDSMLAMFDYPDPNVHAARRSRTTTPLQKLFVLNSPLVVTLADSLGARLAPASRDEPAREDAIRRAYLVLYGRPPSADETRLGGTFLERRVGEDASWSYYAHALLAASEMMYID